MSAPPFFDREQAEIVKQAITYLATTRGQIAINRLAQSDPALSRLVGVIAYHKIPWHNLTMPGWADVCEAVDASVAQNSALIKAVGP